MNNQIGYSNVIQFMKYNVNSYTKPWLYGANSNYLRFVQFYLQLTPCLFECYTEQTPNQQAVDK